MPAINATRASVVELEVFWGDHRLDVLHLSPENEPALDALTGEAARQGLTVRSRTVEAPERVKRDGGQDYSFFKIAGISLVAAAALVAMFQNTWLGAGGDGDDVFDGTVVSMKFKVIPEVKKPEAPKLLDQVEAARQVTVTARTAPSAPKTQAQKRKAVDDTLHILFGGGSTGSVFNRAGFGAPFNDAVNGLKGGASVEAGGLTGLGSRGTGPGGPGGPGGLSIGSIGIPRPGKSPGFELPGGGKKPFQVKPCEAGACKQEFGDGLPKDVVAKVINRHLSEVRFCYERALQQDAALAGKVAVRFVIGPEGTVLDAAVAESTVGDAAVEVCVLGRVRTWRFPEPKGGGVVAVTYPWVFSAAGDE